MYEAANFKEGMMNGCVKSSSLSVSFFFHCPAEPVWLNKKKEHGYINEEKACS